MMQVLLLSAAFKPCTSGAKLRDTSIFDEKTPGAKDAINTVVTAITTCRLERTDPVSEDAVMMNILQVLNGIMNHRASVLLSDQAVCTIVKTCFQVVQQSSSRGDLLQRCARYTMHELIQIIFSRLPEIDFRDGDSSASTDTEDADADEGNLDSGYGIWCAVDIFHFLCSLLNVVQVVETDQGSTVQTADEDVQLFALVLINSAIELSGDGIGSHSKLLRMMKDDLFHHLVHYGTRSSPLVFSMICSTVLNMYHFLRRFIRVQLEAFFTFVLFRVAGPGVSIQLQEVALEGIINFCRQLTFIVEVYVNYDCDPLCHNVFEEIGRFASLVLLVCFGLCFSSTQGYRFYVGGGDGWVLNPSENYIQWSGRNRFQVNDTLYFKYKKGTDSVLVVNKDDFFKCNTKNPIQKLDGGDSEFTLDRSGPFYFISGQNGNCDKGQKLFLVVLAIRHHNKPNPPPVAPTTPPSTSPTSPSPQYPHHPPGASPSPAPVANPPATPPSPVAYPPATSPAPVGYPPVTSPSPVGYPPATSPSPVGYPPATSPSPSTSSPALAPVPSSSPTLSPSLSPPSPPPEGSTPAPSSGSEGPTTSGTVSPPSGTVSPPPGTADSTAPRPAGSGASHSVTAPSSVLVSSVVVFISVALMSSFVQGGAV